MKCNKNKRIRIEKCRNDRDDHVQINFQNIANGNEPQFRIMTGTTDINGYDGLSVNNT